MPAPKRPRRIPYDELNRKLICDKYVEVLSEGLGVMDACSICHTNKETIHRWREEDEDFNERVFEAEANFKLRHLININKAAEKWWAAGAWQLERNFPEKYAQRSTVALEGAVTQEMVKRLNSARERFQKEKETEPRVEFIKPESLVQ